MTIIDNADRPERLFAEHHMDDDVRVVALRGEIDYDGKTILSEALLPPEADLRAARIVADITEVTFMDSVGINVLLAAQQRASSAGGWVRVAGAQESVLRTLLLVGLDTIITCHPTVKQAITG
ncbi:STAS domain-containing protein [Streptomyces sp. NPDC127168]|uniref:STAS domain-containing protein n=1 Tax=unclassified Streptomyces TaxID=2593676 RepID=UPI0036384D75